MCLLHAVLNCGEVKPSDVIAVHVNHGLRATAERDEEFCRELCGRFSVELRVYQIDVAAHAAEESTGVEQTARNMRYDIFYGLVKSGEADVILTAHHALDNAESVLMHMFRGCGLDGACGMPMYSEKTKILRPLIGICPDELDEYVKETGLNYVVDETNYDETADRNFIRLRVVPLIQQRYKGVVRAVNAFSDEARNAAAALDDALDDGLIRKENGAVIVTDAALNGKFAARYIRRALENFTVTDMTRKQIESAVALYNGRTGAVTELAHGVHAARETDGIALYIPREKCFDECELRFGANYIGGAAVDLQKTDLSVGAVRGGIADGDKLVGATLRYRRDGDTFTPFGGKRKKLKQYFIDRKIPARLRDGIPLVCRGNEVLVIVGVEISDGVKVTDKTQTVAAITCRPDTVDHESR